MVSYADFHKMPRRRKAAMELGIHASLGIPKHIRIYLDNGAFYFLTHGGDVSRSAYEEFVKNAHPDWYPIPQDYIPIPHMSPEQQRACLMRTMQVNLEYQHDGYVPVIHISPLLSEYTQAIKVHDQLSVKPAIALGGIVPNLLRAPKSMSHQDILNSLQGIRQEFAGKALHVFGIGGTATLHVAALLRIDSVDSSGWRNRAARGLIQLLGTGDRSVANLGKWRGRELSPSERELLSQCQCPACKHNGMNGLELGGTQGFQNRATHNLWTLLTEASWVEKRLADGNYREEYQTHMDNTIYRPLIDRLVQQNF